MMDLQENERMTRMLRSHTERALQDIWDKHELVTDGDGDYPFRSETSMCWVSIVEGMQPAVRVFALAASKNIQAEARIQFTEANTDDANVAFGLASSVAANLIVDDGAGMRASGTVIAIYKVDGETVWRAVTRIGTTVYTNTSTTTAGGSSYQQLQIFVSELTGTTCTVTFKVDGAFLRDSTTGQTIRHNIAYSGASAMQLFAGAKNGGANNETVNVDYLACGQNLNRM